MHRSLSTLLATFILGSPVASAYAEMDLCNAKVVHSVGAVENPASMLTQGTTLQGITQLQVDKGTGLRSFCIHGGYCYPETVTYEDSKPVKSLKLTNCKIAKKESEDAQDEFWFLDVDRAAVEPEKLRFADVNDKLSAMGMCNSCADNATQFYIHKPDSKCGQLVKAALEGNLGATKALSDNPDFCTWQY